MVRQSKKFLITLLLGLVHLATVVVADVELVEDDRPKGGWFFFGNGLLDSGYRPESGELMMDVGWGYATWRVGGLFKLPAPINATQIDSFRVDVKTVNGSETRGYAAVSTIDDANMAIPRTKALTISTKWQTVTFRFAEMKPDKPERNSRDFTEGD